MANTFYFHYVTFSFIADSKYGWNGVFVAMVVMAIIGTIIFIPMWKMKRDAYSEE